MRVFMIFLLATTVATGQEIVKQAKVGPNACGPCALLNQILWGNETLAATVARIPGKTIEAKSQSVIKIEGQVLSRSY